MEYSPVKFKQNMEKHNFNLKKMFGQNFIIDENIINRIVEESKIDKDTLVIEVGPGAGSLTYKLGISSGHVIAYEIDKSLKGLLEDNVGELKNVEIVYEDFLLSNLSKKIRQYDYKKLYLVANLPYYITTPIILKIVEENIPVDKMVVMVQKEVGDRFTSKPCSKEYSSITVYLNYYYNLKKEFIVSKNAFYPRPNVDSMIISLSKKESRIEPDNEELFLKLVRDSFKFKRKTLRNNLKEYNWSKINEYLNQNNIKESVRAEELDLKSYIEISNKLNK